jgi:hypothetical protein
MLQHGAVIGLAGAYEHDQWSSAPINEMMDLAGQTAA